MISGITELRLMMSPYMPRNLDDGCSISMVS
ncbi:hypothetical protein M673_14380 [Aureimonas sp. AU20]|nr:hypothetical protein M673_14380 [Aureimonas sp. AU20]